MAAGSLVEYKPHSARCLTRKTGKKIPSLVNHRVPHALQSWVHTILYTKLVLAATDLCALISIPWSWWGREDRTEGTKVPIQYSVNRVSRVTSRDSPQTESAGKFYIHLRLGGVVSGSSVWALHRVPDCEIRCQCWRSRECLSSFL